MRGLSIPVLANHVLHCVEFRPAVVGVYDNLGSADLVLLFSVHQRLLLYLLLGVIGLLSLLLSARADYLILV